MCGFFSWVCFKARQIIECGLKAILWRNGFSVRGHSLVELVNQIRNQLLTILLSNKTCFGDNKS
ncbi:MAG: HEPN domain-containing protein [Candidatus Thorarchaeota archaeon]